jgi:cell division protein FtsB
MGKTAFSLFFFVILQANMKFIDTIKKYSLLVWRSQALKYSVVIVVGVLIVGFLDENSLWSHLKNRQRIQELTEEKNRYNADFQRDQAKIRDLDRNPKSMEKIARERYFMKADDEDIFVLSENDNAPAPAATDETAE